MENVSIFIVHTAPKRAGAVAKNSQSSSNCYELHCEILQVTQPTACSADLSLNNIHLVLLMSHSMQLMQKRAVMLTVHWSCVGW